MSRVDVGIVGEPAQLTPRQSSSFVRQPHIADPEVVSTGDEENPEFKLPKISSLAVVIMANALTQVTSFFL